MWTWFSKHSRKLIDGFLSYLDWIKSLYNTVKYKDVQASCTFFFFFFYISGTTYRTNTNGSTPNILFVSPLLYSLTLQGTFVVCAIVKKKQYAGTIRSLWYQIFAPKLGCSEGYPSQMSLVLHLVLTAHAEGWARSRAGESCPLITWWNAFSFNGQHKH